ncbi:hypothetical protein SAMN02745121_07522 [Nannocystis exedens]|uniref:Peptidase family M23 n=1 Tax=Nannocystis exedens TaxID=54 RepID=A0A1I2GTU2_9BACT|nr:M23 family metallopeptidase [Nannocystis exedens]PCC74079.1 hypothetical protein NAEX_07168 [Nannocystis exedens]SFF21055.1 hypothetical protein SAMN02745121_07522 [Nannocystis exedens]
MTAIRSPRPAALLHPCIVAPHRASPRAFGALALALVAGAPFSADAYVLKAPWRGDSLPQGAFLRTGGHVGYNCPGDECAVDMHPIRYDATAGKWTRSKTLPEIDPLGEYDDYVGWRMPFYSPVDGEVIACERRIPEESLDGTAPPECVGLPGGDCASGGNFLIIRTFDDHLFYIAHLGADTIPEHLCPLPATDPLPPVTVPASFRACAIPDPDDLWAGVRLDLRLDLKGIPFPTVLAGDLIGRFGNSGGTDEPHVHFSISEYQEDGQGAMCSKDVVYEFAEAWSQDYTGTVSSSAAGWDPLDAASPLFDGTKYLMWGDPQGPRMDSLDIEEGTRPALALTPGGGVAAFRNAAGKLEVVGFNIDTNDAFDLGVGDESFSATELDLARIGSGRHAVAAIRDQDTRLTLVPYFVQTDGDVVRGTTRTETTPGMSLVKLTRSPVHDGVVAAIKNSQGKISVINYATSVVGETISLTRQPNSDESPDVIKDLDVAAITSGRLSGEPTVFKGVVTVERGNDDLVRLRSWQIGSTGTPVDLVDTELVLEREFDTAFTVQDVDVTVTGSGGRDFIVVSSVTTGGTLRVQSWEISSTGQIGRVEQVDSVASVDGTYLAGLSSARVDLKDAVVAARLSTGALTMISFHVDPAGALRRVGTRDEGGVAATAIDGRSSEDDVVALVPTASASELRLIHYRTNYSSTH